MNTEQLTAKEIKEGMTQGEWKINPYNRNTVSVNPENPIETTGIASFFGTEYFNAVAACRAVNHTIRIGYDPEKMEDLFFSLFELVHHYDYVNVAAKEKMKSDAQKLLQSAKIK